MTALREAIGKAMLRRFEQAYLDHGESYNPDVVWDACDEVIATIVEELTGQTATVKRDRYLIGSMGIHLDEECLR